MRSTICAALLLSFAINTLALSVPGLPSCAGGCVTSLGDCSALQVKCICQSTSLIANLACCVSTACDAADQKTTIDFANALCAGQGVSDLPQSATCAAGASGAASTGSAVSTSSAVSSGTGSGTSQTTTPASLSSALASASASASSAESGASTSATAAITSASASVSSAQASASASNAAAAASQSSEADALARGAGSIGFGAIVAGLIAAF